MNFIEFDDRHKQLEQRENLGEHFTVRAKFTGWVFIGLFLFLLTEILSFSALRLVPKFARLIYIPPQINRHEYETYLADRDPVLGWPGLGWLASFADTRGARISPENAALGDTAPCISIYGDSFAFSAEVGPEHAWANTLARNLDCRVDNYGVGGYGLDQAVLRFENHLAQGQPIADTVILTLYPDNLNRHLNQWRYLLGSSLLSFKPAFHVSESGVVLEPLFTGTYAEAKALTNNPAIALPAEGYAPGSPGFGRKEFLQFPYSVTLGHILYDLGRSFRNFDTEGWSNLRNQPSYYDNPTGPSVNKLAVAEHILERFAATCAAYEKNCVLLVIPDPELVYQRKFFGAHDLSDWLQVVVLDMIFWDATDMFRSLSDICAHVTRPNSCHGHYNSAGYARLANFVRAMLAQESLQIH